MCVLLPPPDHRWWLDISQRLHERWRRRRVVGPRIHSVPGAVQQLVHLAVGQRCQREGPIQMFHVQGSPEQREFALPHFLFASPLCFSCTFFFLVSTVLLCCENFNVVSKTIIILMSFLLSLMLAMFFTRRRICCL